jgi:hypothetical protein
VFESPHSCVASEAVLTNKIALHCNRYSKKNSINKRAEDKKVRYSFWEGEIACSIHACPNFRHYSKVVMRGTVNTFYRGSNPLNAFINLSVVFKSLACNKTMLRTATLAFLFYFSK